MRHFFVLITLLTICSCGTYDRGRDLAFSQNLSGVVTNKYRVKWNHNNPCISTTKISEISVERWCYNNNFWENIQIDDSIYKPSGTLDMWLIKKNGEKILYKHYN